MKLRIALIFVVVAVFSHLYLTNHYYELSFGLSPEGSLCNINKQFSCDTVSASRFSSFLGLPIAAWGAATNSVLLVLLFGLILRWADDLARLFSFTFYLSGLTVLASVVMATFSAFVLHTYCLFCMAAYACSIIVFELLRRSRIPDPRSFFENIKSLFGPAKNYLALLVMIPAGAYLLNLSILSNYGAKDLSEFVNTSIFDWQNAPTVQVPVPPSMVKGAKDGEAKVIIEEFADFRCGHCRSASGSLAAFVASRPDVQMKFYNFPLDSSCNPAVSFGDGVSCLFARAVTCAERLQEKGWAIHDRLYSEFENTSHMSVEVAKKSIVDWTSELGIPSETMLTCLDDEEIRKLIAQQAKAGNENGVKGTPSIYVNGRKLPRGQSLPVLEKAYNLSR